MALCDVRAFHCFAHDRKDGIDVQTEGPVNGEYRWHIRAIMTATNATGACVDIDEVASISGSEMRQPLTSQ